MLLENRAEITNVYVSDGRERRCRELGKEGCGKRFYIGTSSEKNTTGESGDARCGWVNRGRGSQGKGNVTGRKLLLDEVDLASRTASGKSASLGSSQLENLEQKGGSSRRCSS